MSNLDETTSALGVNREGRAGGPPPAGEQTAENFL